MSQPTPGGPRRGALRSLAGWIRSLRTPSPESVLLAALDARGADYRGYSSHDERAIGISLDSGTFLVADMRPGTEPRVVERPLSDIADLSWKVVDPGVANVYGVGPAAFAGALQATAMNATARIQALSRSGLTIGIAGTSPVTICLDGDEVRLRAWEGYLRDAGAGTLPKPDAPHDA